MSYSRERTRGSGWLIGAVLAAALLIFLALRATHLGPLRLARNSGQVCFYPGTAPNALQVGLTPGCYATSCTRSLRRSGTAEVDAATRTIRVRSFFLLYDLSFASGSRACGRDCGGGGTVMINLTGLADGVYRVQLGGATVGEVAVPFGGGQVCFTDQPPFGPELTPRPTPGGYPAPMEPTPPEGYPASVPTAPPALTGYP
jgi:hypothetical protein